MESNDITKQNWQRYHICKNQSITKGCSEKWKWVDFEFVPGLLVVSMVFLSFTFVLVFSEQREKLYGYLFAFLSSFLIKVSLKLYFRCMIMSFIIMIYIFILFITIAKWYQPNQEDMGWFCHFLGFVIQNSEMSAFFWLSALSHNVWNSFRKLKPVSQIKRPRIALGIYNKKYKWYALYAWGCPLIVTFVTVLMQYLPEEMTKDYYTPGIGKISCTLHPEWGLLFYFHIINGPILVYLHCTQSLNILMSPQLSNFNYRY